MVKKSKNKQLTIASFAVGDFVFVKMKGSQPWPSLIREVDETKVLVDFICPEKTWYVNEDIRVLLIQLFIVTNCIILTFIHVI